MFGQDVFDCPNCRTKIQHRKQESSDIECLACGGRFRIIADASGSHTGLLDISEKEIPEPLFLPKGSIRAGVTVALAISCWTLIFVGRDVPGYLLSLMLAVIGYYFGFRYKVTASGSRIYDPSAQETEPLFLPSGLIRRFLIVGFVAAGIVLWGKGKLADLKYLEFSIILFGLVVGFVFGKMCGPIHGTDLGNMVAHLKGLVVLGGAAGLVWILFAEAPMPGEQLPLALAAVISFYFGSRS